MFGMYRTLLALLVVLLHLGGIPVIGGYAVFAFYILSGYLITLIMQKTYGYSRVGFFRYALNRFLRIFPMYWFSCLISIVLILWVGKEFTINYCDALYIPENVRSTINNLFIVFPNSTKDMPRLTPPTWALSIECFFYLCIGLGLSKTRRLVLIWFFLSVAYHIGVNLLGLSFAYKYTIITAASLPFSTGALIYFYKDTFLKAFAFLRNPFMPYLLIFLFFLNWYLGYQLHTLYGISFYINYVLNATMIISLAERTSLPWIPKRIDAQLGDYSYPIYLIHYQVGLILLIILAVFGIRVTRPNGLLMITSIPLIFAVSWVLIIIIEHPIELVRVRIKTRGFKSSRTITT